MKQSHFFSQQMLLDAFTTKNIVALSDVEYMYSWWILVLQVLVWV